MEPETFQDGMAQSSAAHTHGQSPAQQFPVVQVNQLQAEVSTVHDITESRDVQKSRLFVLHTCGCKLVKPDSSPCSSLFPVEEYVQTSLS